jgi:hypothetical protein
MVESRVPNLKNLNGLSKEKTEIKNRQAQAPETHEGASA